MGIPPSLPFKKFKEPKLDIGTALKHKYNNNFIIIIGYSDSTYSKPNGRGGSTNGGWGYCDAYQVYHQDTMKMGVEMDISDDYEEILWPKEDQLVDK